jgi:hypothetical protein
MIYILIGLFVLSFILAVRSMGDLDIPDEIQRLLRVRKIKGTILFMSGKVKHYSSTSSSG